MPILSLESYVSNYSDTDLSTNDSAVNSAHDVDFAPEEAIRALDRQHQDTSRALETVNTLDGIVNILENNPEGLSSGAGTALAVAVEAICSINVFSSDKVRIPAFEEFSTRNHKKAVAQQALEGIVEFGKKVWDYLINAIKAVIGFFKELLFGQEANNKKISEHVDECKKEQQELKKETKEIEQTFAQAKREGNPLTVSSAQITNALKINGKVPTGPALITELRNHFKLMDKFDYAIKMSENKILSLFEIALRSIHKDGTFFQDAINDCQSLICSNDFFKKANNQKEFGELPAGFGMFEAPLIFGDRTAYRTAIIGQADVSEKSIRFFIAKSENAPEDVENIPLPVLQINEVEDALTIVRKHVQDRTGTIRQRQDTQSRLERLQKDIVRIRDGASYQERSSRRAKVMFHVFNLYSEYRTAMCGKLPAYDERIVRASMAYVDVSLKAMKKIVNKEVG